MKSCRARAASVCVALVCLLAAGCTPAPSSPPTAGAGTAAEPAITKEVLVTDLDDPWDVAFLPDGSALYTESPGRLGIYAPVDGSHRTILDPPSDLFYDAFQSGMLGLAVDPDFASNRYVYTFLTSRRGPSSTSRDIARVTVTAGSHVIKAIRGSFTKDDIGRALSGHSRSLLPDGSTIQKYIDSATVEVSKRAERDGADGLRIDDVDNRVVRWVLAPDNRSLRRDADIVTGIPYGWQTGSGHNGGRIRFGPDGYLYVATGDGDRAHSAQSGRSLGGKVLRIDRNGAAAPGNHSLSDFDPRIFTFGHRNPQGLAFRPSDGRPFSVEHGAQGDDEVNELAPGANFGWDPADLVNKSATSPDPPMTDLKKFPNAKVAAWSSGFPARAPSGATFVSNRGSVDWKNWNGALAIAVLKNRQLLLVFIDNSGRATTTQSALVDQNARLRSVTEGPDGYLYISTDSYEGTAEESRAENPNPPQRGEIWRVKPAAGRAQK